MRIVFISSSEYGCPALVSLAKDPLYKPVLVISQPDRPAGRKLKLSPSPISLLAEELGLPMLKPERISEPAFVAELATYSPELLITASYGEILGKSVRNLAPLGAINLHPSLLPRHRGATPIQSALRAGDELTGITIFRLSARMDAGPILRQDTVPILPGENYSSLHDRLAVLSADYLIDFLKDLSSGKINPQEQDDSLASYTHKIEKQDQLINWQDSAYNILCHIRSLSFSPGAYQYLDDLQIKFLAAELSPEPSSGAPGTIAQMIRNIGFTVNTGDQQVLIRQVQPAGKKIMDSWAFSLGSRISTGTKLWK